MLDFLRWLWKSLRKRHTKPTAADFNLLPVTTPSAAPEEPTTTEEPPAPPKPEPTPQTPVPVKDDFEEFYQHTKMRCADPERYGFHLTRETYNKWDAQYRAGVLRRCSCEREVFYVHHNEHVVFLAAKKGHIVTALPPTKEYIRASVGKLKTGKTKAKNAGRR